VASTPVSEELIESIVCKYSRILIMVVAVQSP
jgi:hypothetical protein